MFSFKDWFKNFVDKVRKDSPNISREESMDKIKEDTKEYLQELEGLVWTPKTLRVYELLKPFFNEAKHLAYITSVKRTPEQQLNTIRTYLRRLNLNTQYPEAMTCKVKDMEIDIEAPFEVKIYAWQKAWSHLLAISGIIINPPYQAEILLDGKYYSKGKLISQSPHTRKDAIDIGGGVDRDATNEYDIIINAMDRNIELTNSISQVVLERGNNCVHIGVK